MDIVQPYIHKQIPMVLEKKNWFGNDYGNDWDEYKDMTKG